MKRLAFYLTALFAAFVFAVATTKTYFAWNVQFVARGRGSMGMREKGQGGFTLYDSYDGKRVAFARARFSSSEEADSCFRSIEKKALLLLIAKLYWTRQAVGLLAKESLLGLRKLERRS